jgi:hypothetical protein
MELSQDSVKRWALLSMALKLWVILHVNCDSKILEKIKYVHAEVFVDC